MATGTSLRGKSVAAGAAAWEMSAFNQGVVPPLTRARLPVPTPLGPEPASLPPPLLPLGVPPPPLPGAGSPVTRSLGPLAISPAQACEPWRKSTF